MMFKYGKCPGLFIPGLFRIIRIIPRWIEPDDLRNLGTALVLSIRDYCDYSFTPVGSIRESVESAGNRKLEYPELHPPHAADEAEQ